MKEQIKITIALSFLLLIIASACLSCREGTLFIPEAVRLEPAPMEVTTMQLHSDFVFDEQAANVKYTDKKLVFYELLVEEVVGALYLTMEHELEYFKDYFISGPVRFYLKDYNVMQSIEEGYILNVVGECQGLDNEKLKINDCWVESIIGELSSIAPENEY